jgi:hypothetical protein
MKVQLSASATYLLIRKTVSCACGSEVPKYSMIFVRNIGNLSLQHGTNNRLSFQSNGLGLAGTS